MTEPVGEDLARAALPHALSPSHHERFAFGWQKDD